MLVIVDYGLGNLGSIKNMLKKAGHEAKISSSAEDVLAAAKLILPGVGAFDMAMACLAERELIPALNKKVLEEKTPILGICLGMQVMTERSEEGKLPGLGWIKGVATKFSFEDRSLKVPHMGWNNFEVAQSNCELVKGIFVDPRFYFVHSYYINCQNPDDILGYTPYGQKFASAIHRENIYGVQFHPEKSHKYGLQLLTKFAESC